MKYGVHFAVPCLYNRVAIFDSALGTPPGNALPRRNQAGPPA